MRRGRGTSPRGAAGGGSARRPRRSAATRPGARPPRRRGLLRRQAPATGEAPRPRLTGRFAALVLVLSVLMVSYASSLRAYLEQRNHISSLEADIARSGAAIEDLRREKERWEDPEYLKQQAAARLGWVMPGVIAYRVIGPDGRPLDQEETLSDAPPRTDDGRPLWWQATLSSLAAAGEPEAHRPPEPAQEIRPPKQQRQSP